MYRPITNCSYELYYNEKSLICSIIEENKERVPSDKLLCCNKEERSCSAYSSGCFVPNEIVQCHNLTTFDACKRNDSVALNVCGGLQDSLFCLTAGGSKDDPQYTKLYFPEAIEWILSRNKLEESNEVAVCYDQVQGYQLCNSTGNPTANFTCGDVFQEGCNECNWKSIIGSNVRRFIKGELCEPKAVSQAHTITGLGTIVGILSFILVTIIAVAVYRKFQTRGDIPPVVLEPENVRS
ncbi:14837_t:CDS:2 [Funneliformis caledonium]|uniref:14837_t:CDS:1 n=1 Tax=Funneliformis caledonium TaxID=1117310 RepID=A0A9N8W1T8_9GLOM|nr:14837_t:CDS:2 [Funneliformis caledonium]